jgi:DNA-binding MarR family transcriptional regulator
VQIARKSAMMKGMSAIPDAGPAAFRLVRFWARRWIYGAARQATGDVRHIHAVHVVEAVDGDGREGEVTIKVLAHRLGLDRSVASRMAGDAEAQGFVERRPSPGDARRTVLTLTEAGAQLLAGARAWQRATFQELLKDWDPADRERLAGYLVRLAAEVEAEPSRRREERA